MTEGVTTSKHPDIETHSSSISAWFTGLLEPILAGEGSLNSSMLNPLCSNIVCLALHVCRTLKGFLCSGFVAEVIGASWLSIFSWIFWAVLVGFLLELVLLEVCAPFPHERVMRLPSPCSRDFSHKSQQMA